MNNPKLHHFAARSYQGRFCTPEGGIFVYDKIRPQLSVRLSTPTTEFAETHLYSLINDKGTKNPIHETNFFSELDTDFGELIERVVTSARNGKTPNLNPNEKSNWDKLIFYQWRRLPEVFGNNAAFENLPADLLRYVEEYEAVYGATSEDKKSRLRDPISLKRVAQNAMLEAITSAPSDEIIRILGSKGIAIALIQKRIKKSCAR